MIRNACVALCGLMLLAGSAVAQDFPSRTITLIVPQTPGGTNDTLSRIFAGAMSRELGQEIVVENRPGAGSTIGIQAVADSEPDGYVLGVAAQSALPIAPLVYPSIGYDPTADFEPVFNFANVPVALVVNGDLGVESVDELVAIAKERTGELNYSSGGTGTTSHFSGAMFVAVAGIAEDTVHIPYQGGSQASVAAAAGEVQFYVGPLAGNLMGVIDANRVLALAVSGDRRVGALPDVPTFAEIGLSEYSMVTWFGIVAPAGTPREIIERLNEAGNNASRNPEVIAALAAQGIEPWENTPEEFEALIRTDIEEFARLVADGVVVLE